MSSNLAKSLTKAKTLITALEAFRSGKMVIVVDDFDRENEGDLIIAAQDATPEQLAVMIRHTSGIICAPMSAAMASRLKLPPMVVDNTSAYQTAFTVSVDYKIGLTTGISAHERSSCVNALADEGAQADDFVRPGHVFPLIAVEGGVLVRNGHTEASLELCRMTGKRPVAVLSELMNDDGTVMRVPEIRKFAAEHAIEITSVEEIASACRMEAAQRMQGQAVDQAEGQIEGDVG